MSVYMSARGHSVSLITIIGGVCLSYSHDIEVLRKFRWNGLSSVQLTTLHRKLITGLVSVECSPQ